MSKGFIAAEEGHVVLVLQPQGTCTTAALSGACFSMENWGHATIMVAGGIGSTETAITIKECTGIGGTGATALTYRYAEEASTGGDVLDAALTWSSSVTLGATAAVFMVAEIDGDELADGYPYVRVDFEAGAGNAKDLCAFAVLSGGRFQEDITATVLS